MNNREMSVEQQDLENLNRRSNEPFSMRLSVLLWILLAILSWSVIFGAGLLFFG